MARKKYSVEDRARVLAVLQANNNNMLRTSRDTGIPRKTIIDWKAGRNKDTPQVLELVPAAAQDLASKLDKIAEILSDHITDPDKLAKANVQQIATSFAIVVDKRNLLRGQPTSISEHRSDKQVYEGVVSALIKEAAKSGVIVDRAEALNLLEYTLPDIKKHIH